MQIIDAWKRDDTHVRREAVGASCQNSFESTTNPARFSVGPDIRNRQA